MTGITSYYAGLSAEATVERTYCATGAKLLESRWRGEAGEIDQIYRIADGFVFVEVKKSRDFARAARAFGARQAQRIMRAATEYVGTQPDGQLSNMRFDVALVNGTGAVQVIENAIGH